MTKKQKKFKFGLFSAMLGVILLTGSLRITAVVTELRDQNMLSFAVPGAQAADKKDDKHDHKHDDHSDEHAEKKKDQKKPEKNHDDHHDDGYEGNAHEVVLGYEGKYGSYDFESEEESPIDRMRLPETRPKALEDKFAPTELKVLNKLVDRREELQQREAKVAEKERLIEAAEAQLAKKVDELEQLRTQIEAMLEKKSAEQEAQISHLVKIYETMKPKQAAEIFNNMDSMTLIDVISRMSARKSAPVLAAMDPNRAKEVTLALATVNKLPGER